MPEPIPLLRHQPLEVRWPGWLCRLGWHRWAERDVVAAREVEIGGRGRALCTRISACGRCDCIRHEQNVPAPPAPAPGGDPG